MKTKMFLLVALLAVWISTCAFAESEKLKVPMDSLDSWMGVYYNNTKIGFMHTTISKDKYEGKDVFKKVEALTLDRYLSGKLSRIKLICTLVVDKNYIPLYMTIDVDDESNPKKISYLYKFSKKGIETIAKSDSEKGSVAFAESYAKDDKSRLKLFGQYAFGAMKLAVGDEANIYDFSLWGIDAVNTKYEWESCRVLMNVARCEKLQIDGKDYDTLVISEVDGDKNIQVQRWHLDTGEVLKMEIPKDHITFIREPAEKADPAKPVNFDSSLHL